MKNKIIGIIYPFVSVWAIVLYIYFLFCSNIWGYVSVKGTYILFMPVILFEILATALFNGNIRLLIPIFVKEKIYLLCRIIFWFLIFYGLCIILPVNYHMGTKVIATFGAKMFTRLGILYTIEGYVAYIGAGIFIALYYYIVYKLRIFRVFVSLVLPVFISFLMFQHFYFYGGIGDRSKKEIEQQPGVSVVFDESIWKSMPGFNREIEEMWTKKAGKHPRGIYFDESENAIFTAYGDSYSKDSAYPSILKVDIPNKRVDHFVSRNVQRMSFHGPTIIVAPWGEIMYELSKKDLHTLREIPTGQFGSISVVQAMDVYHDVNRGAIFLGNEFEQMLAKYDYKTGKLLDYIDFVDSGYCIYGGPLHNITGSQATGNLYFTAGPGEASLFEVDPDKLKVLRSLTLGGDLVGSSIVIDDDSHLVYYQAALSNALYEIGLKDFKIVRKFKGAIQSRCLCLDKEKNCLYILSYTQGKLIALDLKSGKHLWELKVGGKAGGLSKANNFLWVNSRAGIIKIDLAEIWKNYPPSQPPQIRGPAEAGKAPTSVGE